MTFETIEMERRKLKIPVAKLCHAAGISARGYELARTGARRPRASTTAKLATALSQIKRDSRAAPSRGGDRVRMFRLLLAMLAREAGIDVRAALNHKAQQKATANGDWMEISRLRDLTCYMLNTVGGWSNAEVAHAAGVTAPAITNAIRKVEDKRELNPELEAVFSIFEAAVQ